MPAYRSQAEAEIRDAVVARIRALRPDARIIHEINVSTYGPNRIDLIAVGDAEIIAVEIKSAKDKLDRLPAQMKAMDAVAHHAIASIHEKFLVEKETNQWAAQYERSGQFYRRELPEFIRYKRAWVFPEGQRDGDRYGTFGTWTLPSMSMDLALPGSSLDLLWRDELYDLCGALRIPASRRETMMPMKQALRWHCTGKDLTRGICAALRARRCVEADPEIQTSLAA